MQKQLYTHHALTGIPLPYVKRETEDRMVKLFKQIERVFAVTQLRVQVARTSFLNYHCAVFKLLDSSREPELLRRIPVLKNHVRLKQHDAHWRCICERVGWTFRPTRSYKNIYKFRR